MWAAGLQGAGAQMPWSGREPWAGGGSSIWLQSSSNMYHQHHHIPPAKKKHRYISKQNTLGTDFASAPSRLSRAWMEADGMSLFPSLGCFAAALLGALLPPQHACSGISALRNSTLLDGWRESPRCTRQQGRTPSLPVLPYKGIWWWCCKAAPLHRFFAAAAAWQGQTQVWILVCCDNQLGFRKSSKKNLMFWQLNKASEKITV